MEKGTSNNNNDDNDDEVNMVKGFETNSIYLLF